MRVMGEMLLKTHITKLDAKPFIDLLQSPYDTTRNKSLLVLYTLADSELNQQEIIRYGRHSLLALLALKQPNNHEFAYAILKKISHQDFGEHDIAAWNAWFDKQKMV